MKTNLSIVGLSLVLAACGGGGSSTTDANVAVQAQVPALDAAKAFLANHSALYATAIPTTGAANFSDRDGCYLHGGWSKAHSISYFDADPNSVASVKWTVGATRSDVQVLADRSRTNADGTTRREIDITYVIHYTDGTKEESSKQTLISGSSSGSTMADGTICTTPENRSDFRLYGNRQVVNTYVTAHNSRTERTALATGLPMSPQVLYAKYINVGVQDPAGVATYATVSGPGIVSSTAPLTPITLKLVSARLLRDDPLFAGKNGNNLDLKNTDSFRGCRAAGGGYATAETADCTTNGATSSLFGAFGYPTSAAATGDAWFAAAQFVAGGAYTIKVYNDDGWKTVNGQAGKTPIATYTSILPHLPFNLVQMAGASEITDLFPRITTSSMTSAQMATAINLQSASITNLTWSLPGTMPDARPVGLADVYAYEVGKKSATQPTNYPIGYRLDQIFPLSGATAASLNFAAPGVNLGMPTYGEIGLTYSNRNGNYIQSIYSFQ